MIALAAAVGGQTLVGAFIGGQTLVEDANFRRLALIEKFAQGTGGVEFGILGKI